MKKMLLKIAFDGTAYHGWQVQPNGITVQQVLQDSLEKLMGVRPDVTGCSRTDSGVHANEFCCHFLCDEKFPEATFQKGLNSVLPDDIVSLECREVSADFHARYCALGKQYIYKIYQGKANPFISRYSWHIERPLDINLLNGFCEKIIGKHDFCGFSSSGRTVENTVRTISECRFEKNGDMLTFIVSGDGFLYNMVRILVGTAIGVADGRISLEDIERIFNTKDRSLAGITAPARALFLNKVYY